MHTGLPAAQCVVAHCSAPFGAYGEVCEDVELLIHACAEELATKEWRRMGARTWEEARAFFIGDLRKEMSFIVTRAYARHRLAREALVGVRDADAVPARPRAADRPAGFADLSHFYAHQVHMARGAAP